jgi:trans-2,3-dihydro-3-hydroxyanthranilate isomerase
MKAGIIAVAAKGDRWTLKANPPKSRAEKLGNAELAQVLGIDAADIAPNVLRVSIGREQLLVPVASVDAVRRANPRPEMFQRLASDEGPGQAYVFADLGDRVESRFFFTNGAAVVEDPATGSACANLGGWFLATKPGADQERVVSQGEAVARPSTLYLTVKGGAILVGGDVIELARGTLSL